MKQCGALERIKKRGYCDEGVYRPDAALNEGGVGTVDHGKKDARSSQYRSIGCNAW